MSKIPLDYCCYLNSSGYSQAAQDVILSLHRSNLYDIRISCFHSNREAFSKESYSFFNNLCLKPKRTDAVQVFHCIPDKQKRFKGFKKTIAFATFETYKPPESWAHILNQNDAVICPSMFNYNIFAHMNIKKNLFYVPHTVDTDKWHGDVLPLKRHERFTFLFVGTWRKRKGWPQLIEAWMRNFSLKDNVQLLIHTDKADVAKKDISVVRRDIGLEKKDIAPIIIDNSIIDDANLPAYFKSADCLIAPSLGEGFGLPALQCMAIKIPVITTNFGGAKDYANSETCTLIPVSGFMVHECLDNIPQFRGCKWPRVSVADITIAMKGVLEDKYNANIKTENAFSLIREKFGYESTVTKFEEMMETTYSVNTTFTKAL